MTTKRVLTIASFIASNFLYAQELKPIYKKHDQTINLKNTILSYGDLFVDEITKIKGNHNYFSSNEFLFADLKYRDHFFFDVQIKYDLIKDNIIIKIPDDKGDYLLVLDKESVESFKINHHQFIKTDKYGFLEKKKIGEKISFYKKHLKIPKQKLDKSFIYYTFKKKEKYYIKYNNHFSQINSKKDLIKILPNCEEIIKTFYKKEKILRNKDQDSFFIKLIQSINKKLI